MATCVVDEPYARGSEAESNSCDTFKELEHVIIVYIIYVIDLYNHRHGWIHRRPTASTLSLIKKDVINNKIHWIKKLFLLTGSASVKESAVCWEHHRTTTTQFILSRRSSRKEEDYCSTSIKVKQSFLILLPRTQTDTQPHTHTHTTSSLSVHVGYSYRFCCYSQTKITMMFWTSILI